MTQPLILASSSSPRKKLLERLKIPFLTMSPDIDESQLPGEKPEDMVVRLGIQKAEKVAQTHPDALIIGADQVGIIDNTILCKPLNHEQAVKQLQMVSGKCVRFLIGLCLLNAKNKTQQVSLETFDVYFRPLTIQMIEDYIQKEDVLSCAGSFRVEGVGIKLVEKLVGDDYTALIGLPLIRLVRMLEKT
jgi:septum formation protein